MPSLAYFAGFFDGEGYVGIRHNPVNRLLSLTVAVTNNHKGVCEMFAARFGGKVRPPKHYGEKAGKGSWVWDTHGANAQTFLRAIRPHVVVKRPQVDVALTFPVGSRGRGVPPDVNAKRLAIKETLMALKQLVYTAPTDSDWGVREALSERADVNLAVKLYRSGMSARKVAERIGVNQPTVSYWLRWIGEMRSRSEAQKLAVRRNSATNRPEAKKAAKLYGQGFSVAEVAQRLGLKPGTVNYWLKRQGVTRSFKDAQVLRRRRERKTT